MTNPPSWPPSGPVQPVQPPESPPGKAAARGSGRLPRTITAATGILLLVAGAAAAGFAGGWTVRARGEALPTPVVVTRTAVLPPLPSAQPLLEPEKLPLPDVRGLTKQDALQALADAGIQPAKVVAKDRPSVAAEGFIIAQDPIAGATDVDSVTIYLPIPAITPDLKGKTEAEARTQLGALGSVVSIRREYVAKATAGTVIRTEPAAGAPLTAESTLIIAVAPASIDLTTVHWTGDCGVYKIPMDGVEYDPAVACRADQAGQAAVFLLNRSVAKLSAVAGIDDSADPADIVRIIVTGDGKVLFDKTIAYGTSVPVDIDLTDVLRMTVTMSAPKTDRSNPFGGLGNGRLYGAPDGLANLDHR